MSHWITEPCIGTCDKACVEVCPVDCIQPSDGYDSIEGKQLYINPDECIDCGACIPECPVEAIFTDDDLPEKWEHFKDINTNYFKDKT